MASVDIKPQLEANIEYRKPILSLRWLLIILASYLTLFTYLGSESFPWVFGTAIAFAFTNVVLSVLPRRHFASARVQRILSILDLIFVAATLYFLRVPETYFYLAFLAVFVLALFWRDLRLVLFSLLVVSLLFGVFNYFRFFTLHLSVNIEQFLTLALFFVVAVFYVFLSERLKFDANLSIAVLEENQIAEVMVEMTRALSSSLNTEDVLYTIASRLRDIFGAKDSFVVKVDGKTMAAQLVKATSPGVPNVTIDLAAYPELKGAYESRKLVVVPGTKSDEGTIVLPMVSHETVLGLIDLQSPSRGLPLSNAMIRFLEITASTGANALRNAQLFEEVQHRARTDSLTGLPNHRFFQATLAVELSRSERHDHPVSLLMIDLDFLKTINDRFGHPAGDLVIRTVADTLRKTCREIDFPARYGGEEFTLILPETDLQGAVQAAERIRECIASLEFPNVGRITASIGVSSRPANALTRENMIRVADQALYVAKNGGRDRVAYFNYQTITK